MTCVPSLAGRAMVHAAVPVHSIDDGAPALLHVVAQALRGHQCVARRDRVHTDKDGYGGVMIFVRDEAKDFVVHIESGESSEII